MKPTLTGCLIWIWRTVPLCGTYLIFAVLLAIITTSSDCSVPGTISVGASDRPQTAAFILQDSRNSLRALAACVDSDLQTIVIPSGCEFPGTVIVPPSAVTQWQVSRKRLRIWPNAALCGSLPSSRVEIVVFANLLKELIPVRYCSAGIGGGSKDNSNCKLAFCRSATSSRVCGTTQSSIATPDATIRAASISLACFAFLASLDAPSGSLLSKSLNSQMTPTKTKNGPVISAQSQAENDDQNAGDTKRGVMKARFILVYTCIISGIAVTVAIFTSIRFFWRCHNSRI